MFEDLTAGQLLVRLGLSSTLSGDMSRAESDLKGSSARMGSAVKRGMAVAGAALAAAGAAALKLSTDLNRGMGAIETLIPGATERIKELKVGIQDLAIETGKSTDDLARGTFQVISAWGDAADTAEKLRINAVAAAAGMATTEQAIALTSSITKAYGDTSAEAVRHVTDLAFKANELGQTTFPEMASAMGKVVPLSKELAISQEELFGVIATGTGVTGNTARVTTQYQGILQALLSPTADLTKSFGAMGIASGKALIEQQGLQGAIETVVGIAKSADEPLQKYIASIEGQTLALALAGPQAETFTNKIRAMTSASGAAQTAYEAQRDGINALGFAFDQFKQIGAVALQSVGDALGDFVGELLMADGGVDKMIDTVKRFRDFMELLRPKFREVGKSVRAFVDGAKLVLKDLAPSFRQAYEAIEALTKTFFTFLSAEWERWGGAVINILVEILDQIADTVTVLSSTIAAGLDVAQGDFRSALANMGRAARVFTEDTWGASASLEAAFAAMRQGARDLPHDFLRVENHVGAMAGSFEDASSSAVQFGFDIDKVAEEVDDVIKPIIDLTKATEKGKQSLDEWAASFPYLIGRIAPLQQEFNKAAVSAQDFVNRGIDPIDIAIAMLDDDLAALFATMQPLSTFAHDLGDAFFTAADFVQDFTGTAQRLLSASGSWGMALAGALELAKVFGLDLNKALSEALDSFFGPGGPSVVAQLAAQGLGEAMEHLRKLEEIDRDVKERLGPDHFAAGLEAAIDNVMSKVADGLAAIDRLAAAHAAIGEEFDVEGEKLKFLESIFFSLSSSLPLTSDLMIWLAAEIRRMKEAAAETVPVIEALAMEFGVWIEAVEGFVLGVADFPITLAVFNESLTAVSEGFVIGTRGADEFGATLRSIFPEVDRIMERVAESANLLRARLEEGVISALDQARAMADLYQDALVRINAAFGTGSEEYAKAREELERWLAVVKALTPAIEDAADATEDATPTPGVPGGIGGVPVPTGLPGTVALPRNMEITLVGRALDLLGELRTLAQHQLAATVIGSGLFRGDSSLQIRSFLNDIRFLGLGDPFGQRLGGVAQSAGAPGAVTINIQGMDPRIAALVQHIAEETVRGLLRHRR